MPVSFAMSDDTIPSREDAVAPHDTTPAPAPRVKAKGVRFSEETFSVKDSDDDGMAVHTPAPRGRIRLLVTIVEGRELQEEGCYASIRFGGKMFQSDAVQGTRSPRWENSRVFKSSGRTTKFTIQLHHPTRDGDVILGKKRVNLPETEDCAFDEWFELREGKSKKYVGEVRVRCGRYDKPTKGAKMKAIGDEAAEEEEEEEEPQAEYQCPYLTVNVERGEGVTREPSYVKGMVGRQSMVTDSLPSGEPRWDDQMVFNLGQIIDGSLRLELWEGNLHPKDTLVGSGTVSVDDCVLSARAGREHWVAITNDDGMAVGRVLVTFKTTGTYRVKKAAPSPAPAGHADDDDDDDDDDEDTAEEIGDDDDDVDGGDVEDDLDSPASLEPGRYRVGVVRGADLSERECYAVVRKDNSVRPCHKTRPAEGTRAPEWAAGGGESVVNMEGGEGLVVELWDYCGGEDDEKLGQATIDPKICGIPDGEWVRVLNARGREVGCVLLYLIQGSAVAPQPTGFIRGEREAAATAARPQMPSAARHRDTPVSSGTPVEPEQTTSATMASPLTAPAQPLEAPCAVTVTVAAEGESDTPSYLIVKCGYSRGASTSGTLIGPGLRATMDITPAMAPQGMASLVRCEAWQAGVDGADTLLASGDVELQHSGGGDAAVPMVLTATAHGYAEMSMSVDVAARGDGAGPMPTQSLQEAMAEASRARSVFTDKQNLDSLAGVIRSTLRSKEDYLARLQELAGQDWLMTCSDMYRGMLDCSARRDTEQMSQYTAKCRQHVRSLLVNLDELIKLQDSRAGNLRETAAYLDSTAGLDTSAHDNEELPLETALARYENWRDRFGTTTEPALQRTNRLLAELAQSLEEDAMASRAAEGEARGAFGALQSCRAQIEALVDGESPASELHAALELQRQYMVQLEELDRLDARTARVEALLATLASARQERLALQEDLVDADARSKKYRLKGEYNPAAEDEVRAARTRVRECAGQEDATRKELAELGVAVSVHGDLESSALQSSFVQGPEASLATVMGATRTIGDYRIESILPSQSSKVFVASVDGRQCVFKMYSVEDAASLARFEHRVSLLDRCVHPNIVSVRAVFSENKVGCIEMPYHGPRDLISWMEKAPSIGDVVARFREIITAVAHTHHRGMVVGCLRPQKVVLDRTTGGVVLTDIGGEYATIVDDYTAPEVRAGDTPPSVAGDMYSIGVMLAQAVTGSIDGVPAGRPDARMMAEWRQHGPYTAEVLELLLCPSMHDRPSALQVLNHPFFAQLPDGCRDANDGLAAVDRFMYGINATLNSMRHRASTAMVDLQIDPNDIVQSVLAGFSGLGDALEVQLCVIFEGDEEALLEANTDTERLIMFRNNLAKMYALFFNAVFDPVDSPFFEAREGSFLPRADCAALGELAIIGAVLAKAMVDGFAPQAQLSSALYKHITGERPTLWDVQAFDSETARALLWTLATPGECVTSPIFGHIDEPVSFESNAHRAAFVDERVQEYLVTMRAPQLDALRRGFLSVPSIEDIVGSGLAWTDLALVVHRNDHISSRQLAEILDYEQFEAGAAGGVRPMFQTLLEGLSPNLMRLFLLATTGACTLPLPAILSCPTRIVVKRCPWSCAPPVPRMAYRQFDLPEYDRMDVLARNLIVALNSPDQWAVL